MNRTEHLLAVAAEECAELAQRLVKAQRFGLGEVQPGQAFSNRQRIQYELNDLLGTLNMLLLYEPDPVSMRMKAEKVEQFLRYSEQVGTLQGGAEL